MTNSQLSFPLKLFYTCFIISILVTLLAVTQTVLVGVFGFLGFDSSTPITATCSTTPYYQVKFTDLSVQYKIIFVHSLVCAISSIGTTVILVSLFIKIRNQVLFTVDGAFKILLYLLASIAAYCGIVEGGYFLTYYTEVKQCSTFAYNQPSILALAIIGMLAVGLAFILWVLLLCIYSRESEVEVKYRDQSEQPVKEKQYEQKQQQYLQPPRQQQNYIQRQSRFRNVNQPQKERHEETQQNLYDSPSKRPVTQTYSQQPEEQPVNRQASHLIKQQQDAKSIYKQMPVLEPRDAGQQSRGRNQFNQESRFNPDEYNNRVSPQKESNLRSDPSRLYNNQSRFRNSPNSRQEQQGLVYHKQANQSPEKSRYMETLLKESKQYLNQRGERSILDSSGQVQERERSDYYKSGNNSNNEHVPHHRRHAPQREGVLLNYIRGKYAG